MSAHSPISLEDARTLLTLVETGDDAGARALLEQVALKDSAELFKQVGQLTRQLHDSLTDFQLDPKIANLAKEEIPDAQDRLTYVMETTETAANRTMDAVEKSMPIAERFNARIAAILPEWQKLMTRDIALGEFKHLCHEVDTLLKEGKQDSDQLTQLLTEILLAQGYQDLTGQVIKRVIDLVGEVEASLVHMLKVFGANETDEPDNNKNKQANAADAEGPIIDATKRDDVVTGQDDVDDLLSSLGF